MNLILTNSGMKDETEFPVSPVNADLNVYEVIRVMDGVALFLEDHFNRLQKSLVIQRVRLEMDFLTFKQKITKLISLNLKTEGNIQFVYTVSETGSRWAFSFIPHRYPDSEDYRKGVLTGLLAAERENPNAKVIQHSVRDCANQQIADHGIYEVLLVDRAGLITEGSRSNVFFVKGDVFYTAPESQVLAGITRQKVLDCFSELGFPLVEEAVPASLISRFDAVFLTGTSPKILPVRSVGAQIFPVQHDGVQQVMECYDRMIADYIANERSSGGW